MSTETWDPAPGVASPYLCMTGEETDPGREGDRTVR